MTQSKLLISLNGLFQGLGALLLLSVGLGLFADVRNHAIDPNQAFDVWASLNAVFISVGHAFFAFLAAAVFRMLAVGRPVGNQFANRCTLVAALAYCGHTVIGLRKVWIVFNVYVVEYTERVHLTMYLILIGEFLVALSPLLYAISLIVVFRHFSKLLTFQSEVA